MYRNHVTFVMSRVVIKITIIYTNLLTIAFVKCDIYIVSLDPCESEGVYIKSFVKDFTINIIDIILVTHSA